MRERLWLSDWAVVGYCAIMAALCVVRAPAIPYGWAFALAHLAVAGVVLLLVRFDRPGPIGFVRCFDALLVVPVLFIMNQQVAHRMNPHDVDGALAAIDRAIGGLALLRSMSAIETRWLTDVFKVAWVGYYFVPLVAGIPVYRLGRAHFERLKNAFVLGWLLTYLCYVALPARGPGYFQEELGIPQPQWQGTASAAKGIINAIEAPEPRHTFPSGHVMVAALVAYFLGRHRLWAWAAVGLPVASAIVLSTLYLRYHYVIDVVLGLALAVGCVLIARRAGPTIAVRE